MRESSRRQVKEQVETHLEEDELLVAISQFREFWRQHSQRILAGLFIAVILLLGVYLFRAGRKAKGDTASIDFMAARMNILDMEYDQAINRLNGILRKHPSTAVAPLALASRGDCYYQLQKYAEAEKDYVEFLERYPKLPVVLRDSVRCSLAHTYEAAEQFDKAVGVYRALIDEGDSPVIDEVRYSLGRCLEERGKDKEALEAYQSISEDSIWSTMARERLPRLKMAVGNQESAAS